ncbi:MAG: hypothetical protein N4A37_11300 [Prolixibacteraceae bacterium]|nr:hypothetical protein [Prolixibacteraceae bacterium]
MMNYSDHFANVEAANKQKAEIEHQKFQKEFEQQKRDKFKFPKDPKVWHFHHIAFVEQMKRINKCLIKIIRKWTYWSRDNSTSATIGEFFVYSCIQIKNAMLHYNQEMA